MAYVIYKGKRVSPMELKMIMEREKREGVEPGKIQRVPEAKKKKKDKPTEKPRPTIEREIPHMASLKLDFEDYPYSTPGPTPRWVEGVQTKWLQYEMAMGKPSQALRERAKGKLSEAEEAKLRGEDVKAGLLFSEYMLTRTGAGMWEGLTMPIRPMAMIGSLTQLSKLLTSHKGIPEAIEYVRTDPGIVGEIAGGALGTTMLSETIGLIRGKYETYKTSKFLEDYPAEKFFVPEEKIFDYPEAIDVEARTPIGIREVTTTIPDEPVATLWPKGKWSKGWGGTAITKLRETQDVVKQWVPIWKIDTELAYIPPSPKIYSIPKTIRGPSYFPAILGGMGAAFRKGQPTIEEPIKEPSPKTQPIIFKGKGIPKIKEPTRPEYVLRPYTEPKEEQRTLPGYIQRPVEIVELKTITKAVPRVIQEPKPIQIQTQRIIQIPSVPTISAPRFERLTREIAVTRPPIKRKKAKKEPWDILTVGEFREYRVKMPKELLKGLG